MIIAVIDTVAKRKPEKKSASMGFEPLTSTIPVTGNSSLSWFGINP